MIVKAEYRIIMGTISLSFGIIVACLSGFTWYNPDSGAYWALITLGSALIGLGMFKPNPKTNG